MKSGNAVPMYCLSWLQYFFFTKQLFHIDSYACALDGTSLQSAAGRSHFGEGGIIYICILSNYVENTI